MKHNSITKYRNILLLHIVVLIFGFTGILGKLIQIPSDAIVWFRMLIATIGLAIYMLLKQRSFKMKDQGHWKTLGVGFLIAAHWILFFEAIKQSNVSVTLATLASASMFTAFLEPLFFKRAFRWYELFLGVMVCTGLYFIFQFETDNSFGILLALIAAFLASLFTVINGILIKKYNSSRISFYELLGGVIAISIYFSFKGIAASFNFEWNTMDVVWLLVLGLVCTAFAFLASVEVMEELTPFTVSLTINLEPVYGILLAFIIFGEEEKMSWGFYLGTIIILSSLFINVWLKRRIRKKMNKVE